MKRPLLILAAVALMASFCQPAHAFNFGRRRVVVRQQVVVQKQFVVRQAVVATPVFTQAVIATPVVTQAVVAPVVQQVVTPACSAFFVH